MSRQFLILGNGNLMYDLSGLFNISDQLMIDLYNRRGDSDLSAELRRALYLYE